MTSLKRHKHASFQASITRQLIVFVVCCLFFLVVAAAIGYALVASSESSDMLRAEIVNLNEMMQDSALQSQDAVAVAQDALRRAQDVNESEAFLAIIVIFVVATLCLITLAVYLYHSVVHPFAKLQDFAEEVASGNLDLPLEYERSNPFGRFAWAFDHMRSELKRARASERAAIEENKSVVASLAHDLRTPVASIQAYSEALSMGLAESEEERHSYAQVIQRRCAEVSQLVDDMLTHSLAELDRIRVECSPVSVSPLLRQVVSDFGMIETLAVEAENATVCADEFRLRQAIENVLVNASKYAQGAQVKVTGRVLDDDTYQIEVRDFGAGMEDADIPFAFNRFYRGSNVGDASGSGLGLYVVRYVIERMDGDVSIMNAHPGIAVRINIPIEKNVTA